jgi:hypothetical protein
MRTIGLSFGRPFTAISVLDSSGQVVEQGILRTTEAAFRHRFGSISPCTVAAGFDPEMAPFLSLLSELGHTVVIGGPVDERLHPALTQLVPDLRDGERRRLVIRRDRAGGEAELMFVLHAASDSGRREIVKGWYFLGPVMGPHAFDRAPARVAATARADEQAAWLKELLAVVHLSAAQEAHRSSAAA